jgi:hypothetical protein
VAPARGQSRLSKAHKSSRSKSQSAGGASIHKNVAYARSAAPRNPNRRRTGGYIGNKTAIVKARFFTRSGAAILQFAFGVGRRCHTSARRRPKNARPLRPMLSMTGLLQSDG